MFIIENWHEFLGLDIPTRILRWDHLVRQIQTEALPPIYIVAWRLDYPDPNNFIVEGLNNIREKWNHPIFEKLLDEASLELNQVRRLKLYQQADKILIEEAVVIPLAYQRLHFLVKPWISNPSLSMLANAGLENVIIEPH